MMRVFGYSRRTVNKNDLLELSEVTLSIDPSCLRQVAAFLAQTADGMEQHGDEFGHEHIKDFIREWPDEAPDIIVAREGSS